jgi:hypothetical protein
MPHIGYDINGKKIMRPAKGDELDKFLAGIEDPTSWYLFIYFESVILQTYFFSQIE